MSVLDGLEYTYLLTNSRKHEDDYYCVAKLTAEDSQYYNYIRSKCVSSCSPPLTASTCGEQRQLALECRDVNTSDQELLTPSSCRRCLL